MKLFLTLFFALLPGVVMAQDADSISQGKQVFNRYCVLCHGDGPGDDGAPMLPGTHAIYIKYRGERPPLLEHRTDINLEFVKSVVRNGLASMPPFRQTEVTDGDLENIVAWFDSVTDE